MASEMEGLGDVEAIKKTAPATRDAMLTTPVPVQAEDEEHLMKLWLHRKGERTRRVYRADAGGFFAHARKPLRAITLGDLQAYQDGLAGFAATTQARKINVVKSLFSFAHRSGYLAFNVGAAVKAPKLKEASNGRYLEQRAVCRMLDQEPVPRDKALLTLLYAAGLRISEAAGLKVRDVQSRDDAGQITVSGKGDKTRIILLSAATWRLLAPFTAGRRPDDAVFRSRKGGGRHLTTVQIHRVVKKAAARAGLPAEMSAHWLRHAHATHALETTKDVASTRATLGHASLATTGRYV